MATSTALGVSQMKVGDLVKSVDPWDREIGIVIKIVPGRRGSDGMIREVQVAWSDSSRVHWAMRNGVKVVK